MITLINHSAELDDGELVATGELFAEAAYRHPATPTSVGVSPGGDPSRTRIYRLSEQGLTIKAPGVASVLLPIAWLAQIGVALQPGLSYAPREWSVAGTVTYDNAEENCTMGRQYASELPLSEEVWQVLDDGEWVAVPTPAQVETPEGDLIGSVLTFTAGTGVYQDGAKFRMKLTNQLGTAYTSELTLIVNASI